MDVSHFLAMSDEIGHLRPSARSVDLRVKPICLSWLFVRRGGKSQITLGRLESDCTLNACLLCIGVETAIYPI